MIQIRVRLAYFIRPDDEIIYGFYPIVDALFQTMSECASLHPDPNMELEQDESMPDFNNPNAGWVFASDEQDSPGPERHHNGSGRFAPYTIPNHQPSSGNGREDEEADMIRAAMLHIQDRFDVPRGYAEDMVASTTGASDAGVGRNVEGQFDDDVNSDMQR